MKIPIWVAIWEAAWWIRRLAARNAVFAEAQARAQALGRPLVVLGAPDSGPTRGPGCGDMTIDIDAGSQCPNFVQADITKLGSVPLKDGSAVVFISYVLEYVDDLPGAMAELRRIAGNEIYGVFVEGWTLTGFFYPGAKRRIPYANGRLPIVG